MRGVSFFIFQLIFLVPNVCLVENSFAQHSHDEHWIISDYIHFDFDSNKIKTDIIPHPSGLITNPFNTAISSQDGELLFHSSGCLIMDRNSNIMENGDSINIAALEVGYCLHNDAIWYQDVLILPYPGHPNKYILFNLDIGTPFQFGDTMYYSLVPLNMLYHIVDMDGNGGLGTVISKNNVAISDTLSRAYVQACKHANGRDWWVIIPKWNSNCYYLLLLDNNGIGEPQKVCSGPDYGDNDLGSQVCFSPDGNWFVRSYSWQEDSIGEVNLFEFDRCSGQLFHESKLKVPAELQYYTGVSFSPNSKYLYISSYKSLWQFDVTQEDIQSSIILAGQIEKPLTPQKGSLYYHQLTPIGKTFIASPLGHNYLSTIHFPNKKGLDSGFKEHDFGLPLSGQNYAGLSNYPNYKLGPLDENACDSLGIDNIPVAQFRYDFDPVFPHSIVFSNLSYFEPDSFFWNFNDGNNSIEEEPVHVYSEEGIYNVCLTASNSNGSDVFCMEINIIATSVKNPSLIQNVILYPQPANETLNVHIREQMEFPLSIKIFDPLGQSVLDSEISDDFFNIDTKAFPPGIYSISFFKPKSGIPLCSKHFIVL